MLEARDTEQDKNLKSSKGFTAVSAVRKMPKRYESKLQGDYTHLGRLHRILRRAAEGELRGAVTSLG